MDNIFRKTLLALVLLFLPCVSFANDIEKDFIFIYQDDDVTHYIYPDAFEVDDMYSFLFVETFDTPSKRAKMKEILNLSEEPASYFTMILYETTWDEYAYMKFVIKDKNNNIIDQINIDWEKLKWNDVKGTIEQLYRDRAKLLLKLKLERKNK